MEVYCNSFYWVPIRVFAVFQCGRWFSDLFTHNKCSSVIPKISFLKCSMVKVEKEIFVNFLVSCFFGCQMTFSCFFDAAIVLEGFTTTKPFYLVPEIIFL